MNSVLRRSALGLLPLQASRYYNSVTMPLIILRCIFTLAMAGLAVSILNSSTFPTQPEWLNWAVMGGLLSLAVGVVAIDLGIRRKRLDVISSVYFGLIVGISLTQIAQLVIKPLIPATITETNPAWIWIQLVLGLVLCYTCISLLLQTKDDFRFVIPYVEFAREIKGTRPCILDTSVIIDGRIAEVVDTQIIDGQLVIPNFVINELQGIADSSDRMRRSRGRRGLDILNRLRNSETIDVQIFERDLPEFAGQPVDLKLVALARHLSGKLITNDYNLNKVAQLQDVVVINLNDLANAMKPSFLPGEQISVRIVKAGEEQGQGIGYLDDGTMVVIENGREHIGQQVTIAVTSVIQKSAGTDGLRPLRQRQVGWDKLAVRQAFQPDFQPDSGK